jgi:SAM-dependent methyltransferase
MELDTRLYHLQGQAALIDNGGIHPKHFLMNYHDFFVSRTNPGERVLDFGCGVGAVAFDLAEKAHAIVDGIDISAENIATARQRFSHERVRYIHGNGLTKSLGETYDVVVLSNVLEHLEDRVPALKSIQRNSGAKRFLIRVPMFERDWRVAYKKYLGVEWRLDEDHKIEFTIEEFRQELNQAGLNITDCEYRWGEIWAEVSVGK